MSGKIRCAECGTTERIVKKENGNGGPRLCIRHYLLGLYKTREIISYGGGTTPGAPTDALPGSDEKVAVFHQRIAARQSLFHPDDARGIDLC